MNSVVQCEDDHYQMALSLKDWSLKMPGKRVQAELRALLPKRDHSTAKEDGMDQGKQDNVDILHFVLSLVSQVYLKGEPLCEEQV